MIRWLRDEALLLLDGRGAILDVARDVTRVLRESKVEGAVIGGVAVVLHGYVRTTIDVDVLVGESPKLVAEALKDAGYSFHRAQREFRRGSVPVHLVTTRETRVAPHKLIEIDGVQTISLPDLINLKLSSGLRDPLRAIDLADVIGLIRARRLTTAFATKLVKNVRPEFRKLATAVAERR